MRRLTDDQLFEIARDILDERIITSNKLYVEFGKNEDRYLTVLKELFTAEALKPYMNDICAYIEASGDKNHILWYGYIKDIPEDKTSLDKAHVIMGQDYLRLIDCMISELLKQGHTH